MSGESDLRRWDELIPDTLGLIFNHLPLQDLLTVIPQVCKSWNKTVTGPYCWQEIDIEEWSKERHPDHIDRMVRMLVTRSSGSIRKLSVSDLDDDSTFSFITEHAGFLQTLRVPRSDMSDSIVGQVAGQLSSLRSMDLSYCSNIGPLALEAIGKNCRHLDVLCRNMHLFAEPGKLSQNDEAQAIATTMPKLKRLEMAYHLVDTESIIKILTGCPKLEFLDLRGCWDVKLDEKFLKEKCPRLNVLGPPVMGYYEINDWDVCSDDFSDGSEILPWEFLAGEMGDSEDEIYNDMWVDDGELQLNEGMDDIGALGWPPSP
jgi:hypothetical protein